MNKSTPPEKEEESKYHSFLSFERFFDLKDFGHQKLFVEGVVWTALKQLKQYLESAEKKIMVDVGRGVTLLNPDQIAIGSGTKIEAGAYIEGPCVIGEGCEVRQGAYIRPYSLIGDGCVVGHCSEIKHAILLTGAKASHFNYVGDSIIGSDVNLGAGVICANQRLDKGEISVQCGGKRIATGLNKLGAIVGDGSSIGCNSVTNPGALFEKGSLASPCRSLKGVIQ